MHVYLGNNIAKFHADPIWNDGALSFVHTGDNVYNVAGTGDKLSTFCRQCEQAIRLFFKEYACMHQKVEISHCVYV